MVRDEVQKRILRWLEERDNQKKQFVFQVNGPAVDHKGKNKNCLRNRGITE